MTPSSFSDLSIAFVRADPAFPEGPRPRAFQRAIGRQAVRAHNGVRRLFSAAGISHHGSDSRGPRFPGFASRNKIAAARRPPLRFGRCRQPSAVQALSARRPIAVKAAMGAADRRRGTTMATDRDDADFEPPHTSSPTDHVLSELQLYGYRPFQDEPDPRPLPQANAVSGAVADIFDALIATLGDTRLEPDLEELLWSTVNLFHRAADRVQRELDDNEDAQKCSQKEQDGSEIHSVELERLVAEGLTLIESRSSMELFRDLAADQFERHTGSSWRPRS